MSRWPRRSCSGHATFASALSMSSFFAICLAVLVSLPGAALATCTTPFTINFDSPYPPGTYITTQYSSCVTFPGTNCNVPQVVSVPSGEAQSGTQVASITNCSEFTAPYTTANFAVWMHHVSIYAGLFDSDPSYTSTIVTLTAYDVSGNTLATSSNSVTRGAGFHTLLSVDIGSDQIDHVKVSSPDAAVRIGFDDFNFANSSPPPPDFSLTAPAPLAVGPGNCTSGTITINRVNGSTGGILFSVSGLPQGVGGYFSPNPATGNSTVFTLCDTCGSPLTPPGGASFTVTGTPQTNSAGTTARSASIQTYVMRDFILTVPSQTMLCASAAEDQTATLTVPSGSLIQNIDFASYGTPTGTCGSFAPGSCNATTSMSVVQSLCLGHSGTCSVGASNSVFGDPCSGTLKSLDIQVEASPWVLPPGTTLSIPVALTRNNSSFSGIMTPLVSGLPGGVTASFNPASVTFGSNAGVTTNLLLTSGPGVPPTYFSVQVSAFSGCETTAVFNLYVHGTPVTVSQISPTSGNAPEGLLPSGSWSDETGTLVTITGSGFAASDSVIFGNPYAITSATSVNGNGTQITARVPRLATTGVVSVSPCFACAKVAAPQSVTVSDYRNTNGFAFVNPGPSYGLGDLIDLYGYGAILAHYTIFGYTIYFPFPDPLVGAYLEVMKLILDGKGNCFGNSRTSEQFLHGDASYSAFPQDGSNTVYGLTGASAPSGQLESYLQAQHLAQFSADGINYWLFNSAYNNTQGNSSTFLSQVTNALRQGDRPTITLRAKGAGHAVVAYGLETGPSSIPGSYYIDVYDSNRPFTSAELSSTGNEHREAEGYRDANGFEHGSRILVYPNHWMFPFAGESPSMPWQDDGFQYLVVEPYGAIQLHPGEPTWDPSTIFTVDFASAAQDIQVTDGQGHYLFNADGTINHDPGTALTDGAEMFNSAGSIGSGARLFAFPDSIPHSLVTSSQAAGVYHHILITPGFVARLIETPMQSGDHDSVTDLPRRGISFSSTTSSKPLMVELGVRGSNGLGRCAGVGVTGSPNGSDLVSADTMQGTINLVHLGAASTLNIALHQIDPDSTIGVFIGGLSTVGDGDSVSIAPNDWNHLSQGTVVVTTKHKLGGQSQVTLGNPQLSASLHAELDSAMAAEARGNCDQARQRWLTFSQDAGSAGLSGQTLSEIQWASSFMMGACEESGSSAELAGVGEKTPVSSEKLLIRPNPLHRETVVQFELRGPSPVRIGVYDVAGRLVRGLVNARMGTGRHDVRWDGRDGHGSQVNSGIYFVKAYLGGRILSGKIAVLR